ncbi:hypothetical protein KKD49_17090 [Myxococcota bacterium]|nr:hypothetical protein [Myxococcota bacterium]
MDEKSSPSSASIIISSIIIAVCIFLTWMILSNWRSTARISEVPENLKKIYEGATIHADRALLKNKKSLELPWFPASTELTPSIRCCRNGKPAKCTPGGRDDLSYNPELWETDAWKDLKFLLDNPHLFRYQFENTSTDKMNSFSAKALWEPQCDGKSVTYSRSGVLRGNRVHSYPGIKKTSY